MSKTLTLPLSKKDVTGLSVGDEVYLSGILCTARDEAHGLLLQKKPSDLPFDLSQMALYHCGPLMRKEKKGWKVISAGPTTSSRMDELTADIVHRFSLNAIIGKGKMGENVKETLKETGVFFVFTGGAGALAADLIKKVNDVFWLEELGMAEAVWLFTVERFGPLIVAIDAKGNSLF